MSGVRGVQKQPESFAARHIASDRVVDLEEYELVTKFALLQSIRNLFAGMVDDPQKLRALMKDQYHGNSLTFYNLSQNTPMFGRNSHIKSVGAMLSFSLAGNGIKAGLVPEVKGSEECASAFRERINEWSDLVGNVCNDIANRAHLNPVQKNVMHPEAGTYHILGGVDEGEASVNRVFAFNYGDRGAILKAVNELMENMQKKHACLRKEQPKMAR